MAHTNSWDETSPTDATTAVNIDNEIRKLRIDVRERCAVDHNLEASDGGEATVGYHKKVTFEDDLAVDPTVSGDVSVIYPKKLSAASNVVPFHRNNVDGIVRVLLGDAYFKVWLYSATAPVGMKASASPPTDCVLAAVGGSTYTTAGATGGAWTISGFQPHTHQWHEYTPGNPSGTRSQSWQADGETLQNIDQTSSIEDGLTAAVREGDGYIACADFYVKDTTPSQDGTWRISAAVNKLYEPDLTV